MSKSESVEMPLSPFEEKLKQAANPVFTKDRIYNYLGFMKDQFIEIIRERIADFQQQGLPNAIRRDAEASTRTNKAKAVIGMRRAGKTYFLFQCLADRANAGYSKERLLYFNFEDERLAGMTADHLSLLAEEYYRTFPDFRGRQQVVWCLDEIQVVPGWERFVRRILDTEKAEIFISGSSAGMLSREVATSMRGRAVETVIAPYSFREFLRARQNEPKKGKRLISAAERSKLESEFDAFLRIGGFPEALAAVSARERVELLQSYVDVVLLRDVGERHRVGNLHALRAFVRHLLRRPASSLSVNKIFNAFRSQGVAVSKGSLFEFLTYLEDAFLVFTLPLATDSERRRQSNPKKLYLADHGLAEAHAPAGGLNRGQLIENIVACKLASQSRELAYVLTKSGYEVDFLTRDYEGGAQLIQVSSDLSEATTYEREIRALTEAAREFPEAELLLLYESGLPRSPSAPENIRVEPLWRWLLE